MLDLPRTIIQVLRCLEEAFSERVWEWAKVLLIGSDPGSRRTTRDSDARYLAAASPFFRQFLMRPPHNILALTNF